MLEPCSLNTPFSVTWQNDC